MERVSWGYLTFYRAWWLQPQNSRKTWDTKSTALEVTITARRRALKHNNASDWTQRVTFVNDAEKTMQRTLVRHGSDMWKESSAHTVRGQASSERYQSSQILLVTKSKRQIITFQTLRCRDRCRTMLRVWWGVLIVFTFAQMKGFLTC